MESLKCIFKKKTPDLVCMLSGNDTYDILCTQMAKLYHIPTIFFPHALVSIRRDYVALEQDYVICTGERDKEYYLRLKTNPDILYTMGLPRFDSIFRKSQNLKSGKQLKSKDILNFGLDPNKKTILLVTTHDEDYIRKIVFISVMDIIKKSRDYQLIVKIHPIEEKAFYDRILGKHHDSICIVKDIDLHDVFLLSDLVIGMSSGAQIEALLLDKTVIDLIYQSTFGRYEMEKFGAVYPVYNPNDLEEVIQNVLYNAETIKSLKIGREKYLKFSLYKFDGKASLRISKFIREQLYR